MSTEPPVYQCPVDAPIQVLGGKWKLELPMVVYSIR